MVAQNETQFRAAQRLRLDELHTRIDDYFGKAVQLVEAGANTLGPLRGDQARAKTLVAQLFSARSANQMYGLGVFYEPYAFDPSLRYFDVYSYIGDRGEVLQSGHIASMAPYTTVRWYRKALAGVNRPQFDGPFVEHGKSYITTMQGFTRNGRVAGVMVVDTLTPWFIKDTLTPVTLRDDITWIESRQGAKILLVSRPFPPHSYLLDEASPLRYGGAILHLSTNAAALEAADHLITTFSLVISAAIWLITGLAVFALRLIWRSRARASRLQLERDNFEHEVAIGKRVEAELRKTAYTDALTGLPNREAFMEAARAALAAPSTDSRYAVLLIDLDRFNILNETLGHSYGDEFLKTIAGRLNADLPKPVIVARLGGDEFVVLHRGQPDDVGVLAQTILTLIGDPVLLGARPIYMGSSIGIVLLDSDYHEPDELLRDADIALYEAKRRGRGRYALFDTAMRTRVAAESDLADDLRRAIERREFLPYYQPIYDLQSNAVVSFEALVRWRRPGSGIVGAGAFIPYAERRGLVDDIDSFILEQVCREAPTVFASFPDASVAVNVSATHLPSLDLADAISACLREYDIAPHRLKIEITETGIMQNPDQARKTLEALVADGVEIVIDDFGTGYSSLAYLHRLPISGLKIDQSFVSPLAVDQHALAIVRSIVALAETLGLYTIAEGVETPDQQVILRQLGVRYAQGFLFSPAVPLMRVAAAATAEFRSEHLPSNIARTMPTA